MTDTTRTPTPVTTPRGTPGVRPRWSRVGWLLVLLGGAVAYVVVLDTMTRTDNVNFFPTLLLVGAATVPAAVLVFAESGGRAIVVPPWVVVVTALVGGVIGTVTAGLLEYDTLLALGALPMLFVGLIEEAAKLVVPVVLFLSLRHLDERAGVIVGVASGMGFAVLETMGYGFQALLSARSVAAVDETLLLRGLLSPACHIAWTGIAATMLWRTREAERHGRAWLRFAGTYLAVAVVHAVWDGSTSIIIHAVIAAICLVALLVLIHRAHRRLQTPPVGPAPDLSTSA